MTSESTLRLGDNDQGETVNAIWGGLLVVIGLIIISYTATNESWYSLVRQVIVELGAILVGVGVLIGVYRTRWPMTPRRAWLIPFIVGLAQAFLIWVDLQRSGPNHFDVGVGPMQPLLVSVVIGIPLGAAIKFRESVHVTLAVLAMMGHYIGIFWYFNYALAEIFPALIMVLAFLGLPAVRVGYTFSKPDLRDP